MGGPARHGGRLRRHLQRHVPARRRLGRTAPRIEGAAHDVAKEHRWLPWLAPSLPVAVPGPLGKGTPAEGYPWQWSVYRWLDGETPAVGRLAAVIDFGCLGLGDPAVDLIVAWYLLPVDARGVFRTALGTDDATWARGRGWALSIALSELRYYRDTHPVMAAIARQVIEEVRIEHAQAAV
ncbi:phosphotransferase [Streptomyces glebosus]|uniref:phosphotransferase n=1 Tax=Streptomyces glebosus TaxID=249580 RepID=UPI0035712C4E